MSDIDFYLTQDHAARGRTMRLSTLSGAVAGGIAQIVGFSLPVSIGSCLSMIAVVQAYRVYTYEGPAWKQRRLIESQPLSPRLKAVASAAIVFMILASLPKLAALAVDRSLQTVSAVPSDANRVRKTRLILDGARSAQLKLSPAALQIVGARMLDAATSDVPGAWDAAVDVASYRSVDQAPSPALGKPNESETVHYELAALGGQMPTKFETYGRVPRSQAAQMYKIGGKDENRTREYGAAYLLVHDGVLPLDGNHLKNIVFKDSTIRYGGGPVVLDHVSFINCTFQLLNDPKGQRFAQALLASPHALTLSLE